MNYTDLIVKAVKSAINAGKATLEVYNSEFAIKYKNDKSPLTQADIKSNEIITQNLQSTNIPILSEEGREIPYEERKNWEYLWLIDPLDGTKEFIKRNGEFTVNIALIHNQRPVQGIIYVPVSKTLYFASKGIGAFKIENAEYLISKKDFTLEEIIDNALKLPYIKNKKYKVVASRSHMSPETVEFIEKLRRKHNDIEIVSSGSSLKLCMVAEGKANIYPRFAPTMEWDTGAGHAIVEQSGGKVTQTNQQNELVYNKENLLNPWFIVSRL